MFQDAAFKTNSVRMTGVQDKVGY